MDVELVTGHVYRAALGLSALESAFAGTIPGELEKLGFADVELWDDKSQVPAEFSGLKLTQGATHWAEAVYKGSPDKKTVPPQVLSMRDDGVASSTRVKPLAADAPQWTPQRKKGLPLPTAGAADPACDPGYTRVTPNSPCFALVPPGTKQTRSTLNEGWGPAAKVALTTVVLGVLTAGALTIRYYMRKSARRARRERAAA